MNKWINEQMNENLSKCEETSAIDSWRNSDEYISKFNINVLVYTYYDCDSLEKVSWQAGWFKEEKERRKKGKIKKLASLAGA